MQIALYRGIAPVSGVIEWGTRSVYSHAATWFPEAGELWEALDRGFVKAGSLGENHEKGTVVDLLEYKVPLSPEEAGLALATARSFEGAPYDFVGVFAGFALKLGFEPRSSDGKLFCSEGVFLIAAALGPQRLLLERTQPWKVPPEGVNISPLLKWVGTEVL